MISLQKWYSMLLGYLPEFLDKLPEEERKKIDAGLQPVLVKIRGDLDALAETYNPAWADCYFDFRENISYSKFRKKMFLISIDLNVVTAISGVIDDMELPEDLNEVG